MKEGENQKDRGRDCRKRGGERNWKIVESKRGRELIVAEEKKEVECDGGVCDADSSMPVTLAGEEGEPYRISMFSPPQQR